MSNIFRNRFPILFLISLGFVSGGWGKIAAEPVGRTVDIRAYGIDIPPGVVQLGENRVVQTRDRYGQMVNGRVHLNVGDYRIVLLPDGQLVPRHQRESVITEGAFSSADMTKLGAQLVQHEFPGFKFRKSVHYLYVYNTSEEFASATGKILEKMTPGIIGYMNNLGLEVHVPEVPLVVVMFRTEAEFHQYRELPPGLIANYHTLTNRVVMFEESRLTQVKPDLALKQKINTIAHEGVHQLLHNTGVQARMSAWPMWITEGIAEYLSPTSTGKYMRWKGAGQVNDFRMAELERFLSTSTKVTQSPGDWLTETVLASRLDSNGYASAWALTHYLAKTRRVPFNGYMQALQKLGPLDGGYRVVPDGTIPRHRELYAKFFDNDFADTETRLKTYLTRLPYQDPFIDWPHVSVVIGYVVNGRLQKRGGVFHNQQIAKQWIDKTILELEWDPKETKSEMKNFNNRVLAERYVRSVLRP